MQTLRKAAMAAAALTLAGMAAGTAQAQSWGGYGQGGYGQGYGQGWGGGYGWQGQDTAYQICSGQRAHSLEARLRHKVDEGNIDPRRAGRIHEAIDNLEARQRNECGERDWRSISDIAGRYNRIEGWINAEARQGSGWGWNNGSGWGGGRRWGW